MKALLKGLITENRAFIAGPILFELLQGVGSPKEKKQVREALLSVNYVEISSHDWEEAAALSSDPRARGITIPMTDLLIAQLARKDNLEVLSLDLHFDQIPGLSHQKLEP